MGDSKDHVLACVTGQRNCERIIRHSAYLAETLECPVTVIHVAGGKTPFMGNSDESEALEYLFGISKEFGADMTVIRAQDVADAIARQARKLKVTHIVMGGPVVTSKWDFPERLKKKLPGVGFYVIPSDTQPLLTRSADMARVHALMPE